MTRRSQPIRCPHRIVLTAVAFTAVFGLLTPQTSRAQEGQPSEPQPADDQPAPDTEPAPDAPEPVVGDRPAIPAAQSTQRDRLLADRLRAAFSQVDVLSDVEVGVDSGVVTLTGSTPSPRGRNNAERIAARFEHTLFVDNQIDIAEGIPQPAQARKLSARTVRDEEIQSRLTTVFERVEELKDVEVDVASGVVHLEGTTTSQEGQKRAEDLASKLAGVLYVDNDVEVSPDVSQRVSPVVAKGRDMLRRLTEHLPLLAIGLVILALFAALSRLIGRVDWPFDKISSKPLVQGLIRQTTAVIVFLSGMVFVLQLFDLATLVGAVLGTAGVAGLALGFAFRDIAENYLASIILSIEQPFHKNDFIEIGDHRGKVIRMTTRDTVLMTLDGNHVRIPNAVVFKGTTSNYTRNPLRRFECPVGISVDENLMEVQNIGLETLSKTAGVADDPEPFMYVQQLADSNVVVHFYAWVDQDDFDWRRVRSESLRRVKSALDAAGIEMPEPIQRHRVVELDEHELEPDDDERIRQAEEALHEPGPSVEPSPEIDRQIEQDRNQSDETDLLE